jgi:hypothetical protein
LKRYASKVGAIGKRGNLNQLNTGGYDYAFKTGALFKSSILYVFNAVSHGYVFKIGAVVKSILPNLAKDVVRNDYADKGGTVFKSILWYVYKGAAGKVEVDVFDIGHQHCSKASLSGGVGGGIIRIIANVQFDVIRGREEVEGLCVKPYFKIGNGDKGVPLRVQGKAS